MFFVFEFDCILNIGAASKCQFHQLYTCTFCVQTLFWQLFSSYMYIEKSAKMTYVRKICTLNVDEIDSRIALNHTFLTVYSANHNNSIFKLTKSVV